VIEDDDEPAGSHNDPIEVYSNDSYYISDMVRKKIKVEENE